MSTIFRPPCPSRSRAGEARLPAGGAANGTLESRFRANDGKEGRRSRQMVKASWNGATIAESDDIVVVEGNHYFPRDSVDASVLRESMTASICPWKGIAHYHTIAVDGAENK